MGLETTAADFSLQNAVEGRNGQGDPLGRPDIEGQVSGQAHRADNLISSDLVPEGRDHDHEQDKVQAASGQDLPPRRRLTGTEDQGRQE